MHACSYAHMRFHVCVAVGMCVVFVCVCMCAQNLSSWGAKTIQWAASDSSTDLLQGKVQTSDNYSLYNSKNTWMNDEQQNEQKTLNFHLGWGSGKRVWLGSEVLHLKCNRPCVTRQALPLLFLSVHPPEWRDWIRWPLRFFPSPRTHWSPSSPTGPCSQ